MFYYAVISKGKIEIIKCDDKFKLPDLGNIVGEKDKHSCIECVYPNFSIPNIIIVCDDVFALKQLPFTVATLGGIKLGGTIAIVGTDIVNSFGEWDLCAIPLNDLLNVLSQLIYY